MLSSSPSSFSEDRGNISVLVVVLLSALVGESSLSVLGAGPKPGCFIFKLTLVCLRKFFGVVRSIKFDCGEPAAASEEDSIVRSMKSGRKGSERGRIAEG